MLSLSKGETLVRIGREQLLKEMKNNNPEILVVDATIIDSEIIDASENLKFIQSIRGNPINIDLEYCKKKGIKVGRAPARNANSVAEFTFGLILNLTRQISAANHRLLNGEFLLDADWRMEQKKEVKDIIWNNPTLSVLPYYEFQSGEIAEKTLGLVGFGAIGELIAKKGKAFDLKIIAYDPYLKNTPPDYVEMVSLEELAKRSDIVSIHAKETAETVNIIDKGFFSMMKKDSYLINTSRGKLVERFALIEALNNNRIAGAAIDVFDYEPLCVNDPLLKLDNILLTPHIGGASSDVIKHHSNAVIKNIDSYFQDQDIVYPYQ